MCGIVGQVRFDCGAPDRELLMRMCGALVHRGPDSRGIHLAASVGLGVQRLRVIDIATGDQPISNEDGQIVVVLNGEIYNFAELRNQLQARGHRFATRSDTEVIVHLYEEHGDACVDHLAGMFAFALWDARRQRLLLARDRVGKKPLFYALRDGVLSFASELAALMQDASIPRDVDLAALDAYFTYRYVPSPASAFRAVRKLPPAHRMTLDADGATIERYWRLDFSRRAHGTDEELLQELHEQLRGAVRRRLVADVPVGAFLSGGVDSAAIVAFMAEASPQPIKTFTVGFGDPAIDERDLARTVAEHFGTEHRELVVEADAAAIIPQIVRHYGEPFADATAIPTFALAEMARRDVTVALNGDGGDETFAGYPRYRINRGAARAECVPLPLREIAAAAARRVPPGGNFDSRRSRLHHLGETLAMRPLDRYIVYMTTLQGLSTEELYTDDLIESLSYVDTRMVLAAPWMSASGSGLLDRMLEVDTLTYLPDDLLTKVDIASMAHALECRSPMVDHEFMQFAASLPEHLKLAGREHKAGLRRMLRGIVPDPVLDAPKRGFQPPLAQWFRSDLREFVRDVLLCSKARERGWFKPASVLRLIDDHQAGRADNSGGIWTLMMFELWCLEHVDVIA